MKPRGIIFKIQKTYSIYLYYLAIALLFMLSSIHARAADNEVQNQTLMLQILGSGGPNDIDGRASSGYLVWIDGKARLMIDAGGGTSLRYGQTDADIKDLDLIAVSHLHVDHSVDVMTMIKRSYFYNRTRPLIVVGPSGNVLYPDIESFLQRFLDEENGAYRYMFISRDYPIAEGKTIEVNEQQSSVAVENDDYTLKALGVGHSQTPTLAYRVDTPHGSIAFGSDQNGRNPEFAEFVKGVDILVMHFPRNERPEGPQTYWHANPSTIGKIAQKAGVKRLVLSHFMEHSLNDLDNQVAIVKEYYDGPVDLATDLQVFIINSDGQ